MGRSHLEAIHKDIMTEYIAHHITLIGAKMSIFSDIAIKAILQGSGGQLRRVNSLCKEALFVVSMEKVQVVISEHVKPALTELS
jgi:type II secretory pathway predicted ATPase ExeA